jgi:YNFM family putative membrane transporter
MSAAAPPPPDNSSGKSSSKSARENEPSAIAAVIDDAHPGTPDAQPELQADAQADPNARRGVRPGTPAYRRISAAFFCLGFATFALLYCVQPLLPVFAQDFAVSPAESSLALSLSTAFLAVSIFCAAAVSEGLGRRGVMFAALAGAAVLNLATAVMPDWHLLLVVRALEGLVLGGVPAVAMAYLAEEIEADGLGQAMGLYIAGSAFGGMIGRVGTGVLAETFSWRIALAVIGIAGLVAALGFIVLVPPSRNFTRRPGFDARFHARAWASHLRNPALASLFAIGGLAMGAFVVIYNYAGFRLMREPYALNQTQLGLIFTAYLFGIASSSIAGQLANRFGRARVMTAGILVAMGGVVLTLASSLPLIILGIVVLTTGFFAAHTVASSWLGPLATHTKGHASSLYLLSYYLGSSIMGSAGGWFWLVGGWGAIVGFTLALYTLSLAAAWRVGAITAAIPDGR